MITSRIDSNTPFEEDNFFIKYWQSRNTRLSTTEENIERHCNCKNRPDEKILGRKLNPPTPRMSAPKNRQWSEATFREVIEE